MKNQNTIFYIIGGIFLVGLLIYSQVPKETGMISLTPHFYKDGVEVVPEKSLFTIITPPGGSYDQISFSIPGTASGEIPFSNIQIVDSYPLAFKNSLPSTTQSLTAGQSKTLWTSSLIDTEQFEGQTINFWIEISAVNDYTEETVYADRAYSGDVQFEPDCIINDDYSCSLNDVYWYDSCGVRGDKKTECGSDYYTGSNYCYNNDVYRDRIDNGCSGSSCYSNTIKVRQEDCGALGCSGGVCNPESGWSYQESADSYSINSKIFAITYMKPAGATSNSLWKVKYGGRAIENITIPNDCWNYYLDKIELRFYGCANCYSPIYPIFNYGNVYGQCYNGNWKRITTETGNNAFSRDTSYEDGNPILHDGNWNTGAFNFYDESDWSKSKGNYPNMDATVFEEAMWWDIE